MYFAKLAFLTTIIAGVAIAAPSDEQALQRRTPVGGAGPSYYGEKDESLERRTPVGGAGPSYYGEKNEGLEGRSPVGGAGPSYYGEKEEAST